MQPENGWPVDSSTNATPIKPGVKTTEFWATLAFDVAMLATAIAGALPSRWAAIAGGVATVGYQLSRGLAKSGPRAAG